MQQSIRPVSAIATAVARRAARSPSSLPSAAIRPFAAAASSHAVPSSNGNAPKHFSSSARQHAPLTPPVNLPKWLSENSHLLQPPVNNYCVTNEHMTVMIVGGPNARTDYHINTTPEWFYQYKGRMLLKVIDGEHDSPTKPFRDIYIDEGEMFLLPPNVPHNPVRFANTVGVVLEQPRPEGSVDKLRWYCQGCGGQVHEKSFHCTNLGTQIKEAVNAFKEDEHARTCKKCGTLCDVVPKQTS
ncbi:putative 3-hydroxyanthranilate -dioxygenase protein [Botryosphaeria dothidea]|uniref:3-hydroxyanthranilate 3,4-dioxygenase n=1 Tax=Botryosphaeria dothidea TaxID=55169 RepID=A0A8H4IYA8_9PEZI|nr:putative 3-hydroxyanthranilate -dioxygenase protein [Botryosphaeria dothidea]